MRDFHDRRNFLKGALLLAAGGVITPFARAATKPVATSTSLAKGLTLISGVGANVLALDVGDGVLLVDSGLSSEAGALISPSASRARTSKT